MSEQVDPVQDPPAGADRSETAVVPPVTSAAMPSTTAAVPAITVTPSVVTMAVTTTPAAVATTAAETATAPAKKSKNWKLKRGRRAKAAEDSASQQDEPGTDHPTDPPEQTGAEEQEETTSKGVESTAVPPPPPPPGQEPAAPAEEMSPVEDESVQAVANLLVAEGLDGPPSNISMPGRSAPTSSGGGMPQYFDLAGHKVMPTRHEDRAWDLFHGKVTPIMLQVKTVSAVDLPEGRQSEFVLDHAHLHLLDRIQSWCDKDVSDTHLEVTRMKQLDGTWSFMADGVVQLILGALDLPPHTSMIQMGDEGAALSAGVLPVEPPVTVAVTTVADGAPTLTVQVTLEEPRSDSHLLGGERGSETVQGQEPAKETSEEPAKKTRKCKKETKKKASKAAKKARKLSSSEDGETTPSPVASGSGIATGEMVPEQEAADPPRPKSPLPFHEEGPADVPAERTGG